MWFPHSGWEKTGASGTVIASWGHTGSLLKADAAGLRWPWFPHRLFTSWLSKGTPSSWRVQQGGLLHSQVCHFQGLALSAHVPNHLLENISQPRANGIRYWFQHLPPQSQNRLPPVFSSIVLSFFKGVTPHPSPVPRGPSSVAPRGHDFRREIARSDSRRHLSQYRKG